jgi:hypothetical protein
MPQRDPEVYPEDVENYAAAAVRIQSKAVFGAPNHTE